MSNSKELLKSSGAANGSQERGIQSRSITYGGPTRQEATRVRPAKSRRVTRRGERTDQVPPWKWARRTDQPRLAEQLDEWASLPTPTEQLREGGDSIKACASNWARWGHKGLWRGLVHPWVPVTRPSATWRVGAHLHPLNVKTRQTMLTHASHDKACRH